MDITYDEAMTIRRFVPQEIMHIINYTPCDANNHILNTLLIKLLYSLDIRTVSLARMPNIAAAVVYMYFAYRITYEYLSRFVGVCCYLLLVLNPFLLDFFSIARGYGLALGFQMASLYFMIAYIKQGKSVSALWSVIYSALAVLSNFALLNYFVSILFIQILTAGSFPRRYHFRRVTAQGMGITLIVIAIIYEPIRKMKEGGSLFYGGAIGFYEDTLISLTKYTFYSLNVNTVICMALNLFLIVLCISVVASYMFKQPVRSGKSVVLLITALCIFSTIVQHYLLGILYLIDRTALFFYPMLIFCLSFSINDFEEKWYAKAVNTAWVTLFAVNFFYNANLYKTATWYFDSRSSCILTWLNEQGKARNKILKIDYSWPFESSIGYYFERNNYPFVPPYKHSSEFVRENADYYIYLDQSLEKVEYNADKQQINLLDKDTARLFRSEHIIIFSNIRRRAGLSSK